MSQLEDPLSVDAPESGASGPVRNLKKGDVPLAGDSSARGQSSGGEGSNAAEAAGQMVTVNWNGAQRQMPMQELVRLAQQAHRAQEIEQSARTMLREDAELQALKSRIQQFDPEEMQAFSEFIMNPKGFRRPGAAAAVRQENEVQAMNGMHQGGEDPRFDVLMNGMRMLLEREQQRERQSEVQTREQQVDKLMGSFPVFKDGHPRSSAARGIAREAIMDKLASSPGARVEDVVAQQAAAWNAILANEAQQRGQQEEVVTWPSGGQPVGQQQQPISNPNPLGRPPQSMREAKRAARSRLGL